MRFRWIFLTLVAAGLIAAAPPTSRAAIVGDAAVSYSATRIVTVNGKDYIGKVFVTPGKQRHDVDINGIAMSFILDIADGKGVVVVPGVNSFVDFPLPPLLSELNRHRLDRHAVGNERIGGMRATKYRLDYTASDGTRGEGFLWLGRDNILLRLDGRILRPRHRAIMVTMRLEGLKFGRQNEALFDPPKGMRRLPYKALEMLLDLRLRSHPNR
jgi:hypothetical protein